MALEVGDGVACVRVRLEAFWQEHGGADMHVGTPKSADEFAFYLHVLDPVRIFRRLDRRDLFR